MGALGRGAALLADGGMGQAIEVLEGHLAETPDHAGTLYNLACAHARAGRADVALDHLRRAIELQESFATYAGSDEDLASIRDDPRFPAAPDDSD